MPGTGPDSDFFREYSAFLFRAAGFAASEESTGRISPVLLKSITAKYSLSRRSPRFQLAALAAADDLLTRFPHVRPSASTALIVSSVLGPQGMISGFQDDLLDYPEDQVMAGTFSHSVHNAPAGGISILLGLTGPSFSVTGTDRLFAESLKLAHALLQSAFCDSVLLIAGEEKTVLADALRRISPVVSCESAAALYLEKGPGHTLPDTAPAPLFFVQRLLEKGWIPE